MVIIIVRWTWVWKPSSRMSMHEIAVGKLSTIRLVIYRDIMKAIFWVGLYEDFIKGKSECDVWVVSANVQYPPLQMGLGRLINEYKQCVMGVCPLLIMEYRRRYYRPLYCWLVVNLYLLPKIIEKIKRHFTICIF